MSAPWRMVVVAGLVASLIAGCRGDDGARTFDDPRGPVEVEAGKDFSIELGENPSTGYLWRFAGRPDPAVVRYLGSDFELEAGGEDRAGAGGTRTLRFRAVAPGQAEMVLRNVFTGGEPGRRPAAVRRIVVTVSGS